MATLVELLTISCYASSADEARFIYKEIYEDGCYDVPGLDEAHFIIDVEANIGLCSLYMKQRFPSARFFVFEPAPETYNTLCQDIALHNISGVEPLQYGCASEPGTAKLTFFPNPPGNSTLVPEENLQLYEEALERLSHFLSSRPEVSRIDILKVDVEGAELEVLRAYYQIIKNVALHAAICCDSRFFISNITDRHSAKSYHYAVE
ncbi:FkbM family methyltransferase [Xylaria cubensis]|nr:FkbM family methyltransferase [Xylaria cubensis]